MGIWEGSGSDGRRFAGAGRRLTRGYAGWTGVLVCGELGSGVPWGEKASLAHEEAVGRQAQGDVVIQAAPGASLEVAEPDLLLEVAVVLLDPPAPLGMAHQIGQRRLGRQRDQPVAAVAGRVGVLDQQPLLRAKPAGRGAVRRAANRPPSLPAAPPRLSTARPSSRARARASTRAAPARASPRRPRRSSSGIPEPTGAASRSHGTAAA